MTREQAYKKFKKIDSNIKWVDFNLGYMKLLDDIYDDFENRTCESCKHNNNQCVLQTIIYNYDCFMDLSKFCCNKYEPKENK